MKSICKVVDLKSDKNIAGQVKQARKTLKAQLSADQLALVKQVF